MKKLMISLAALTAIGAAVPAAAQTWGYGQNHGYTQNYGYGQNDGYGHGNRAYGNDSDYRTQVSNARYNDIVQRRLQLSRMIASAERRGQISSYESIRLRQEVGRISIRANNARRGGLTNQEVSMAMAQLDRVAERLDGKRRSPQYGYNWSR